RILLQVVAQHLNFSAAERPLRPDDAEGRRLSGAVGAEDDEARAVRDLEVDPAEDIAVAKALSDLLETDRLGKSPVALGTCPPPLLRFRRLHGSRPGSRPDSLRRFFARASRR